MTRSLVLLGAASVAVALAGGCKKKQEPAPAAEPSAGQAAGEAKARPARPASALERRAVRRMEPIEVQEAAEAFAPPDGTRVVTELARPGTGDRVQGSYCFEGRTTEEAAEALRASLEAAGWKPVHVRAHPSQPDRITVAAARPPYRMTAAMRRVDAPKCAASSNDTFATVTIHKVGSPRAIQPGAQPRPAQPAPGEPGQPGEQP